MISEKDILVIDDVISKEQQNFLEKTFTSSEVDWYYSPYSVRHLIPYHADGFTFINSQHFMHNIINHETNAVNHKLFPLLTPLISAIPYKVEKIIRGRINLTMPIWASNENYCGLPHADYPDPDSLIAIYYINDSTGDTVLFREREPEVADGNLTYLRSVSPKKGRMVVFPSNLMHAPNTPRTQDPRLLINLNFVPAVNVTKKMISYNKEKNA